MGSVFLRLLSSKYFYYFLLKLIFFTSLYSKLLVFPVITYGHENWTIKKAEHQKTDAFELWC